MTLRRNTCRVFLAFFTFCACANGVAVVDSTSLIEALSWQILARHEHQSVEDIINSNAQATSNAMQTALAYIHGDTQESADLAKVSNLLQDFATVFNAKDLKQFEALGNEPLKNLTSEFYNFACQSNYLNCDDVDRKIRAPNGLCNNLEYPLVGAAASNHGRQHPPAWHNVAVVNKRYEKSAPFAAPLGDFGVQVRDGQFQIHLEGDGPVELALTDPIQDPPGKCIEVTCTSTCNVNGFITKVQGVDSNQGQGNGNGNGNQGPGNGNQGQGNSNRRCDAFTFRGRTLTLDSAECTKNRYTMLICYKPFVALVELAPNEAKLTIGDGNPVTYQGRAIFPTANPNVQPPPQPFTFKKVFNKFTVSRGCDSSSENVILEGKLPPLYTKLNADSVMFDSLDSNGVLLIPVVNTLFLKGTNEPKSLGNIAPIVFAHHNRLIFGTNDEIDVSLRFKDNTMLAAAFKTDGLTVSRTGVPDVAVSFDSNNVIEEFEHAQGFKAFWMAWIDRRVYIGHGNTVASNPLYAEDVKGEFVIDVEIQSADGAVFASSITAPGIPRGLSQCGLLLPSARDVSLVVHSANGKPTPESTLLTLHAFQWGQFLDHDVTLTPTESNDGHAINCDAAEPPQFCFNIPVTEKTNAAGSQGQFPRAKVEFIPLVRSAAMTPCVGPNRDFRDRVNQNLITAQIDASNVYGSSKAETDSLRNETDRALLKVSETIKGTELPPEESMVVGGEAVCNHDLTRNPVVPCKAAGDVRVNEQTGLTSMHTVWVREHNRIATVIKDKKPETGPEKVFQITRRIVIAQMQDITYNEFARVLLDRDIFDKERLGYDQCVHNPKLLAITNYAFNMAFRLGHTMMPEFIARSIDPISDVPLQHNFFNPEINKDIGTDKVISLYPSKPCQKIDSIHEEVTTEFILALIDVLGIDLAAVNIQRGRDHGLSLYPKLREYCGLQPVHSFDDLSTFSVMDEETIKKLKEVYAHVGDIDVFTAVISERQLRDIPNTSSNSPVGETMNCILAKQFNQLKCGDRQYYEFTDSGFTPGQAKLISEKTSFASVLCHNTEVSNGMIQPRVFELPNNSDNVPIQCEQIPALPILELLPDSPQVNQARSMGENKHMDGNKRMEDSKRMMDTLRELLDELQEMNDGKK